MKMVPLFRFTVACLLATTDALAQSVTTYSRTGTGNIAPLRTLLNTGFSNPWGVLVDVVHDEIAVANNGAILGVYPRTGNGPAANHQWCEHAVG
jgi:hypothetical protein